MARINCPNCKASISDKAIFCPHCHHRMKEKPGAKAGPAQTAAGPARAKALALAEQAETVEPDETAQTADPPARQPGRRKSGPQSGRRKSAGCFTAGCLIVSAAVILGIVALAVVPILPGTMPPTPVVTRGALADAAIAQFSDRLQRATVEQTGAPAAAAVGAEPSTDGIGTRVAAVDYVLGDVATEKEAVQAMANDFHGLVIRLAAAPAFDTLEVRAFGQFHDEQGNEREEMASRLTITRAALAGTDWRQLTPRHLNQVLSGENGAVFMHPLLREAWDDYQLAR